MRGAEPQGRERTGDYWGREWGGRRQGEQLERKQQVKPQGNKGQRMVMRGRRERTLGHWHSGGVGGHSEIEMLEDKVSSKQEGMDGKATLPVAGGKGEGKGEEKGLHVTAQKLVVFHVRTSMEQERSCVSCQPGSEVSSALSE